MSVVRGQVIFRVYSNNETFENWNLIEDIVLCLRFLIWCRRWRTIKVRCSLCRCRVSPLSWHSSNMKSHIITRMSIIRCSAKARPLHATVSIAIFILNKASAHDPPYSPAGRWSLYIYIYIYSCFSQFQVEQCSILFNRVIILLKFKYFNGVAPITEHYFYFYF